MKFANHYNVEDYPVQMECNFEPSQTIPDQVLPITEILKRYASGLSISGTEQMYEGDENLESDDINDGIDPRTLDLSERMDLINYRKQELAQLKNTLTAESLLKKQLAKDQDNLDKKFQQQKLKNNIKNNNEDNPPHKTKTKTKESESIEDDNE